MTQKTNRPMVTVSCETLMDLHMAAYDHDHAKYPSLGKEIMAAQEEARQALYACGWWQHGDED